MPKPAQQEKSVSLWSIIKECVGKDLSKVCLPVYFNEPLSMLQRIAEELEYSPLLDKVRLMEVICFTSSVQVWHVVCWLMLCLVAWMSSSFGTWLTNHSPEAAWNTLEHEVALGWLVTL